MSMAEVREGLAMMHAGYAKLAEASMDLLTATELLEVGDEVETLTRQLPTQSHRMLARLQTETTPQALGAKSFKDVLAIRWRISPREAHRRLAEAAELGPRQGLTGERLDPLLPAVAAAQSGGLITAEHVAVLRDTMGRLPGWVDAATRAQIEVDLVRVAVGVGPRELKKNAERRLFLLDQDGPEPDDTERARKRGISVGKQGRDGMSAVTGWLTPEARATWEPLFAKFAAPGMCNPDDDEPCVLGTPSQAQIDNDHRSLAQRQHDAFVVVGRIALMGGTLGQLNGLPVSIIIRTTLQDLESRAGVGVSGGGTIVPIADVIRLAAHANHFLAVFDEATGSALDLFRARRVASPAQRIMLIGRDGGCTKPSCTVGPYGTQVHHAAADWADDGNTNVDDMGLACGPDNRMVGKDGWTTKMNDHHQVEWIPPPHLDTGQARVNHYHRPESLFCPTDDAPEPQRDNDSSPCAQPEPDPLDPWAETAEPESVAPQTDRNEDCEPAEPFDPWGRDDIPTEPGDCALPPRLRVDGCVSESFDPWRNDDTNGTAPPDQNGESSTPELNSHEAPGPKLFDPWGDGPDTSAEPVRPA
jgi:hypothetical protein